MNRVTRLCWKNNKYVQLKIYLFFLHYFCTNSFKLSGTFLWVSFCFNGSSIINSARFYGRSIEDASGRIYFCGGVSEGRKRTRSTRSQPDTLVEYTRSHSVGKRRWPTFFRRESVAQPRSRYTRYPQCYRRAHGSGISATVVVIQ